MIPLHLQPAPQEHDELDELFRRRPRSRFLQLSSALLALLAVGAWFSGEIALFDLFSARRLENLERFLTVDLVPHPLRGTEAGSREVLAWAAEHLAARGWSAAAATLAIAVLAIVLAQLLAWVLAPLAARNFASAQPLGLAARPLRQREELPWRVVRACSRSACICLRAIPEYVLAFLLLTMLGPGVALPLVLALALHNAGILGRLDAETLENLDPAPLKAWTMLGARRSAVLLGAAFPLALGRALLYFFYRFETCVREATVLGMLGVVSLGYWIQEARAKGFYDEMLLYVLLGAAIVLLADLASGLARRALRRTDRSN